jgi:hypothetical protein
MDDNKECEQEMVDATNPVESAAIGGRATIFRLIFDAIVKGTIKPIHKFHAQRKENDETKRIKAAFTLPRLNEAAKRIAFVIANEPPAQMPVLRGLVDESTTKATFTMERRIESLEDQLKATTDKKAKKSKGDGKKKEKKEGHSRRPQENQCPQSPAQRSRQQQQRYRARQRKGEEQRTQEIIRWEEGRQAHRIAQIKNQAAREIRENFGFIPNVEISTHLNARHVLGKTPTGVYFAHFTNKQFHDFTTKKIIPAAASTVLGFGLKFIPVPKKSIH